MKDPIFGADPETLAAKGMEIGKEALRLAAEMAKLSRLDLTRSVYSTEADALSEIAQLISRRLDSGNIRLVSALHVLQAIFEAQEDGVQRRMAQLERRHGNS